MATTKPAIAWRECCIHSTEIKTKENPLKFEIVFERTCSKNMLLPEKLHSSQSLFLT